MNFPKMILAAIVGVLLTPGLALAGGGGNDQGEDENGPPRISAQEITGVGLAGAAVLGAVGYLVLRRRSQHAKN